MAVISSDFYSQWLVFHPCSGISWHMNFAPTPLRELDNWHFPLAQMRGKPSPPHALLSRFNPKSLTSPTPLSFPILWENPSIGSSPHPPLLPPPSALYIQTPSVCTIGSQLTLWPLVPCSNVCRARVPVSELFLEPPHGLVKKNYFIFPGFYFISSLEE